MIKLKTGLYSNEQIKNNSDNNAVYTICYQINCVICTTVMTSDNKLCDWYDCDKMTLEMLRVMFTCYTLSYVFI